MAAVKKSPAKKTRKGLVPKAKKAVRAAEEQATVVAVKALARIPAVGEFPGGDVILARKASERSADFVSHAQILMTGQKRPRTGRLPLLILNSAPQSEAELAELTLRDHVAIPNFLERVAARAEGAGDIRTAVRLRRRAIELEPDAPHRHLALARTLNSVPEDGVVHDWIVGLSKGRVVPNSEQALDALKRAHELAPGNPYILHEYGTALFDSGDVKGAIPLLETAVLKSPRESWFMQLAEVYRRPDVAKFEKAMTFYERVFEKDPGNTKALSGIINAGTRGPMEWPRIWRSVRKVEIRRKGSKTPYKDEEIRAQLDQLFWREGDPSEEEVSQLVQALRDEANQDSRLHPMVLGLVITRLQFARYFSAGFRLREDLAKDRTRTLRKTAIKTPGQLRNLMKAHVYLDDAQNAADLAHPRFWGAEGSTQVLQVKKLRADAELMTGKLDGYVDYSREARERTPLVADDTMEKLIKGKRVALVGPAETGDRLGHIIDEYDVVVRPRYQPEFLKENRDSQGSRTDITYYSGQDLTSLFESISTAAESGEVKVVNARPFSYAAHAHRDLPWLRFYRQDFSLCFHGGSLGIQRMAYDLLQFEPAEICVFNSDLYTGNSMFTTGWRHGDTFGPYSHINDIVVSHDVKSEFRFMKALMSTGVVTAQGRAAEVLAQTPEEYVRAVEEAGVLR